MAVVSSRGSSGQTSLQQKDNAETKLLPENSTTLVDSKRYVLPSDGKFANEEIQRNVFTHATAYNVDRFPDALGLTFAYGDGFPISVTYFNVENPALLGRANPTDVSTGHKHSSHVNYLKIVNFEMRLEKPLDMAYQEEEGHMTVEGEAIIYPGMKPQKGDIFYYLLNDGQWGIMAVRGVQRLSISSGTLHRITFELQEYLTPARQEYIEAQVVNTAYFDKIKFFTQQFTLLKHESYILLQQFTQLRKEMISYYLRTYYDQTTATILDLDGLYDPYLISYLQHKISVQDHRIRPKQLYARLYDFEYSIWYVLTRGQRPNLDQIKSGWRKRHFQPSFWNADITSLVGRDFVGIGREPDRKNTESPDYTQISDSPQDTTYAGLSQGFYDGDLPRMNIWENLIYSSILGNVDPKLIHENVKGYMKWDKDKAFYDIPLALHLIDRGLFDIRD